jgi:hypothetical protein
MGALLRGCYLGAVAVAVALLGCGLYILLAGLPGMAFYGNLSWEGFGYIRLRALLSLCFCFSLV